MMRAVLVSAIVVATASLQLGVARADGTTTLPTDPIPSDVSTQLPVADPVPWGSPLPDAPVAVPTLPTVTTPNAAPVMVQALTKDVNGNGRIDLIQVIFNAPMDTTSTPAVANGNGPGITVEGYTIPSNGIAWHTTDPNVPVNQPLPTTNILDIGLMENLAPDTNATPKVTYTAKSNYQSNDPVAKAMVSGSQADTTTMTALDQAAPVLLSAGATFASPVGLLYTANGDQLSFTFSEPVRLLGTTPLQRWDSLEKAITFWNQPVTQYCTDGTGAGSNGNFPQPGTDTTSPDAIDSPAAGLYASSIVVTMKTGTTLATGNQSKVLGYPGACPVSVDAARKLDGTTDPTRAGYANRLLDVAGNGATGMQGAQVRKVSVFPAGANLVSATTLDGSDGAPNGILDGVSLTFDRAIDASSIAGTQDFFGVSGAHIDSIAAGSSPTVIDIHFTSTLGTAATPRVSYASPDDCVNGAAGLKSGTPFANPLPGHTETYTPCAPSFGVIAADGAAPMISSANTADSFGHPNGKVDKVHVTFTEPLFVANPDLSPTSTVTGAAGVAPLSDVAGWSVDGYAITGFAPSSNGIAADLTLTEGPSVDGAATPDVTYGTGNAKDVAGNSLLSDTVKAADGVSPVITSETVTDDGHGSINRIVVTFSEKVKNPVAQAAAEFHIDLIHVGDGFAADGTPRDDALTVKASVSGTKSVSIVYIPTGSFPITDVAGNSALEDIRDPSLVTDKAAPAATISTSKGDSFASGAVTITAAYGEAMATDSSPVATFDGANITPVADPAHTNGWRADGTQWEGTYTVPACTADAGCPKKIEVSGGKDASGNSAASSSHNVTVTKDTGIPDAPDVVPSEAPDPGVTPSPVQTPDTGVTPSPVATPNIGQTLPPIPGSPSPSPSPSKNPKPSPSPSPSKTPDPEVQMDGPAPQDDPFVASGDTTDVTWTVEGGNVADNPITIEYSTDGGNNYEEINDGDYSHANDGQEAWNVPSGSSFDTMVRVSVRSKSGAVKSDTQGPFVQGVAGYLVDGTGNVLGYGSADTATRESYRSKSDTVRGIAVRKDLSGGYVVAQDGVVYPFATGGHGLAKRPASTKIGGDLARGIVLRTATSGYVLDAYGRIFPFGGAPAAHPSATWKGHANAKDIEMLPSGRGGYVLDLNGKLYPFTIGSYKMPPSVRTSTLKGTATSIGLRSNGTSGWVLSVDGVIHQFGGAPSMNSSGTGPKAAATSLLVFTTDGGYWVDRGGHLHTWGSAWGNPSTQSTNSRVRAAS